MTRIPRRASGLAASAVLATWALGGCAAGLGASTQQPYSASNGTVTDVGDMNVQDVAVVDDGNVPELSAALINVGSASDQLTGITISGASKPTLPFGGITLLPQQPATIGPTGANRVVIDGLKATLGQVVTVTFSFRDAGTATVDALVLSPSELTAGG